MTTTMINDQNSLEELSWRIPADDGDSTPHSRMLVRILLLATIYVGILWIFSAKAVRLPGLAALVPLIAFMLFFAWRASRKSQVQGNNVRLTKGGLSWTDGNGASGQLPREKISGFRIGLDSDTMRAIPALTLILASGIESQPVELHTPATPAAVRDFLCDRLGITENDLPDEEFAGRLHAVHLAAFSSWTYDSHEPAKLLLRTALIHPIKQEDGRWLLCSMPKTAEIIYDPERYSYELVATHNERIGVANVSALIDHVNDVILPEDRHERNRLVEQLQDKEDNIVQQSLVRDCRAIGFYFETDKYGRWHLVGTRESLLTFCHWMAESAGELRLPSVGEKPATRKLGGETINITVQVDHQAWIDEGLLSGPKEFLIDTANRLSESLLTCKANSEVIVRSSGNGCQETTFVFHVKEHGYDPASRLLS